MEPASEDVASAVISIPSLVKESSTTLATEDCVIDIEEKQWWQRLINEDRLQQHV